MAAILLNIGTLALRSMAKPLSGHFTNYVMGQPTARDYVIGISQVCPATLHGLLTGPLMPQVTEACMAP